MSKQLNYTLAISVADSRWKTILPAYENLVEAAMNAISQYLALASEISILLTNDEEIQRLNKKYRGKDKPTNVLSFPQDEKHLLGDIALSLDTLKAEAETEGKTLAHHFTHLLVHGVLHLLGKDHENDDEQKDMESLEIKILSGLKIPNPYI